MAWCGAPQYVSDMHTSSSCGDSGCVSGIRAVDLGLLMTMNNKQCRQSVDELRCRLVAVRLIC